MTFKFFEGESRGAEGALSFSNLAGIGLGLDFVGLGGAEDRGEDKRDEDGTTSMGKEAAVPGPSRCADESASVGTELPAGAAPLDEDMRSVGGGAATAGMT
jgi:hypothetical protein